MVILHQDQPAPHAEEFLEDLDGDGAQELVGITDAAEGLVLSQENHEFATRFFPGKTYLQRRLGPFPHFSGLDHLDADGDGADDVVVGVGGRDSLFLLTVTHWLGAGPTVYAPLPHVCRPGSTRIAGWAVCQDPAGRNRHLVAAVQCGTVHGFLCGFRVVEGTAESGPRLEPAWSRRTASLVDFLGAPGTPRGGWSGTCCATVRAFGERMTTDSLLCVNGLDGSVEWRRFLGFGGGGVMAWSCAGPEAELLVSSGRPGFQAEGYMILRITREGERRERSNVIGEAVHHLDVTDDSGPGGAPEILVCGRAGRIHVYRGSLDRPSLASRRLADAPVWCVPFHEGRIRLLAGSAERIWLLDHRLRPVASEALSGAFRFKDPPLVYDHPMHGKVLLAVMIGDEDQQEYRTWIDPLGGDPLVPAAASGTRTSIALMGGLLGLGISILLVSLAQRRRRSAGLSYAPTGMTELQTALRDFRHNQPTWRVFRGLSRLLLTLPQRLPPEQEKLYPVIEQRLNTLQVSSLPAMERIVDAARHGQWHLKEIEKLQSLKLELERLLELQQGGRIPQEMLAPRAQSIARTAGKIAD
ncbi:MAG: hypothetical protein GF355_18170, partial [Candidatus Eisenbacteria bacterium]|nr:hypothetical protein [Candidatus Eisenbacteria bacterium]